ncbi:hypothetical protein [Roseibium sp.]|uniref:hypothetical protein n=1 Tax=Roseibium sp. TaxID=1936156 RepID=UPI003A98481B
MQPRHLAQTKEEPIRLGKLAAERGLSPSIKRENALLFTGLALLIVAASMVAGTLIG